jgi:cellulose synthase/poly-beta-1,6-N-acetylglucosamine synthase-like glycosyltransferase
MSASDWAALVFWIGVAVPVYTYFGYPVALLLLRQILHREVKKRPYEPFVSLIVPAYNEAAVIERKIQNSLAIDYPPEKLEILIASDGSKDQTAERAKKHEDGARVRVFDYKENRGKIRTLNATVEHARGEILVFSDAAAILYPESLRYLMMNFADPAIGAASGKYTIVKPDDVAIGKSEDFYWKYETFLKCNESEVASTLGGHGQLNAIRKELYPFPSPETINDDYVIPVSVLRKRYRAVYEPKAVVFEEAHEMTGFKRRVRIMAGNIQQISEIKGVIRPFRPLPLFFFLSHKVSRLLVPFGMLAALIANLFLLDDPLYLALFVVQLVFYGIALLGTVWQLRPKMLLLPFYFCMINVATFFGLYHALTSRRAMAWK